MRHVTSVTMQKYLFETYHPFLIFVYFALAICLTFFCMHPVYIAISFCCASCYYVVLKGWHAYFSTLKFLLFLAFAIAGINAFFSGAGSSILFTFASCVVTFEALMYGLCAAGMLCAVLLWFFCCSEVLSNDKSLFLFGRLFPCISMVISMVFSFVPRFISKGHTIQESQKGFLGDPLSLKEKTIQGIRVASVLAGLSMEDSIITASSMNARGFGSVKRRGTYMKYIWHKQDSFMLCILLIFFIIHLFFAYSIMQGFTFYPEMQTLSFSPSYIAYAAMLLLPVFIEGKGLICAMR